MFKGTATVSVPYSLEAEMVLRERLKMADLRLTRTIGADSVEVDSLVVSTEMHTKESLIVQRAFQLREVVEQAQFSPVQSKVMLAQPCHETRYTVLYQECRGTFTIRPHQAICIPEICKDLKVIAERSQLFRSPISNHIEMWSLVSRTLEGDTFNMETLVRSACLALREIADTMCTPSLKAYKVIHDTTFR